MTDTFEYLVVEDVAKKMDFNPVHVYRINPIVVRGGDITPDRIITYLDLVYQDKWQGMRYTDVSKATKDIMERFQLSGKSQLIVDGTGVGEAVIDIMRNDRLNPLSIVITGGTQARPVYSDFGKVFGGGGKFGSMSVLKEWHVPKEDLVHAGMIVLQQSRLRIAANIKYADDLRRQLEGFKGKLQTTGNVKYENETDDLHDDLVLNYLMAAWYMQTLYNSRPKDQNISQSSSVDYNPFDYL